MERLSFAQEVHINRTEGEETVSKKYIVPVNPVKYEKPRMELTARVKTLDGQAGYQHAPYNYEIHKFKWDKLPAKSAYYNMAQQLKLYNGKIIYIKEGSAGTDRNELWKRIFVINVMVEYDNAPNIRYYYKSLELLFVLLANKEHIEGDRYSDSQGDWEPQGVPPGKQLQEEVEDPG